MDTHTCTKCGRPAVVVELTNGAVDLRHEDGRDHGHAVGIFASRAVNARFQNWGRG